jgi:hypothetical protein
MKITLDAYGASHRAVREMKEDGLLSFLRARRPSFFLVENALTRRRSFI